MRYITHESVTQTDTQVYSLQGHKLVPANTYVIESGTSIQTGDVCPYDSNYVRYLPVNPQDGFDEYYIPKDNVVFN